MTRDRDITDHLRLVPCEVLDGPLRGLRGHVECLDTDEAWVAQEWLTAPGRWRVRVGGEVYPVPPKYVRVLQEEWPAPASDGA